MAILNLPTELIIHLFSLLPLTDILSFRCVNKFFHNVISHSVLLQYTIESNAAGVTNNPLSTLSVAERLQLLVKRESSWARFEINFRSPVPVLHTPSGIYDLTGGIYLLGHAAFLNSRITTEISFVHLPTSPQTPSWAEISINRNIIDVALAVQEHNLIAIVTSSEHDAESVMILEIVLLNLSTGGPHSEAADSLLYIPGLSADHGRCMISVEIVGNILAILVVFPFADTPVNDQVYIFDWKKGKLAMFLAVPHDTYCGLIFLSDDAILLPNRQTESLDLFHICTSYTGATILLTLSRSLSLPKLAPFSVLSRIVCRCEPNPVGRSSPTSAQEHTRPFDCSPQDALVLFNIYIDRLDSTRSFSFVVHRRSLLALLPPLLSPSDPGADVIPWADWGPPVTRWFNMDNIPTRWITTTHGQRFVFITPSRRVFLLDFNPYRVRRFDASAPASSHTPFARVKLVQGDQRLFPEESYVEKVSGHLPYIESVSIEQFDYDAVLLDEERIIGMRYGLGGSVRDVEVLYFG